MATAIAPTKPPVATFTTRVFHADIHGESPIQFSRYHNAPKLDANESPPEYDDRTWREKAHVGRNGNVVIPANMLISFLRATSKEYSLKLKGMKTFGKVFAGGVMIYENADLGVTPDALQPNKVFVHSNGRRGPGTRVWRTFPILHDWATTFDVHVMRSEITEDILREHLAWGFLFIGLGAFRPENGNPFGRASLVSLKLVK